MADSRPLPYRRAIASIVGIGLAVWVAVYCLDRLFWKSLVERRGGSIQVNADGHVYSVSLHSPEFDDGDVAMAARIPTLEELRLNGAGITDKALILISRVETLKYLNLSGTAITDAGLVRLSGVEELEILELRHCPDVTGAGVRQLHDLPNLERLDIDGIDVTFAQLLELQAQFPNTAINVDPKSVIGVSETDDRVYVQWRGRFEGIELTCQFPVTRDWLFRLQNPEAVIQLAITSWTPDAAGTLSRFTRLRTLQVTRSGCDDRAAAEFALCPELTALSLGESSITDAGLEHLARLKRLQSLRVSSPNIRGDAFSALGNLHDLRSLSLVCPNAESYQSMEALSVLKGLRHLSSLHLQLPVAGTEALVPLRDCANLQNLYLCDCGLTDESVMRVGTLPQVVQLDLTGNALTAVCVESLLQWTGLQQVTVDAEVSQEIASAAAGRRIRVRTPPANNPLALRPCFGPHEPVTN